MSDYRDRLYSTYYSSHASALYGDITIEEMRKRFRFFKSYFGQFLIVEKSAKILDIGSGIGKLILWLKELGYTNTTGIDINEEQVKIANDLGISEVKHCDIVQYLGANKNGFDMIFAIDVIEHFRKDEILGVLELIYGALKENGMFIIQVPNGESPFTGRYRYGDFTHEVAFTTTSISQLFRVIGFKDIVFKPAGPIPHGVISVVKYVLWKVIEALLKTYMSVETGSSKGIFTQNIIAVGCKP
ncbi:MAG: class I SAM-dependent methyltransferase [Nitrospirae bacterium]|nr:class I SAM-dependent methyltransferase [Nitrospirota bacterium]